MFAGDLKIILMKKILFSLIILGLIFIVSCDKTPHLSSLKNTVWRSVENEYSSEYRVYSFIDDLYAEKQCICECFWEDGSSSVFYWTYQEHYYDDLGICTVIIHETESDWNVDGIMYYKNAKLYLYGDEYELISY